MEQFFSFTVIDAALSGALLLFFIVLLCYYLVTYARPARMAGMQTSKPTGQPPVSVIVYSLNESDNLRHNLPELLEQNYPKYEVIVVNDGSTDESEIILKMLEARHKHLYHTYIPENVKYLSRKKLALTIGIKAAKYDVLLFTEANCRPLSKDWITAMARNYTGKTDIVLGFSAYGNHKGFRQKLIAYDNLLNGLQYLSPALTRRPYSGNGRNLSYTKEMFFRHKGYYKSLNLHAGDDDLFVNQAADRTNTGVEYLPAGITQMGKIQQMKLWKGMKISRAATQKFYKGGALTFYRAETCCFFLFLLLVIAAIVYAVATQSWIVGIWAALLYAVRLVVKAVVFHKASRLLQQKPLSGSLFALELVLPLYNLQIRIYRLFRGKEDYTFRFDK